MPHEVADVEPVLAMLSQQNKIDSAVCIVIFLSTFSFVRPLCDGLPHFTKESL